MVWCSVHSLKMQPTAFRCARACRPSRAVVSSPHAPRRRVRVQAAYVDDDDVDDKVAAFLREQDMTERGLEQRDDPTKVIGDEEVDEEQAKTYCRDIIRVLRLLKEKRDMELREAKLVISIDDPRNDDARRMGIEDSSGVSRDEMAMALEAVAAGEVPTDRIALRVLHAEMTNWPFLDSENNAQVAPATLEARPASSGSNSTEDSPSQRAELSDGPKQLGRDPTERPQGIQDMLPEWMGYGAVYFFTIIPVLILGTVVAILFFSSLK